jgi:hypothetical protein
MADYIIHLLVPLEVRVENAPDPEVALSMAQFMVEQEKIDQIIEEALDLTSFYVKPVQFNFTEEAED